MSTHVCVEGLNVPAAAPAAATRPAGPGSVLLAGFLKELGRSNCISLKTTPGFWLASLESWCLQLLVVVLCSWSGGSSGVSRWSPLCPAWEPHTHLPPPPAPRHPLWPPPPGKDLFLPLSPWPGWLGGSRNRETQVCPKNRRPEQWVCPLLTGMPGKDLKGPSLCVCITILGKSIL